MTNQEMIDEMLKMQRALDEAIYKEHGCEFNEEKCTLAMIDEIGEFNHEIKSTWCWWKKSQTEMDREKALEELVDIWHFALSLTYHYYVSEYASYCFCGKDSVSGNNLTLLYLGLIDSKVNRLETLFAIGLKFGFSLEDVYNAYKKKNQVNYERLANNY